MLGATDYERALCCCCSGVQLLGAQDPLLHVLARGWHLCTAAWAKDALQSLHPRWERDPLAAHTVGQWFRQGPVIWRLQCAVALLFTMQHDRGYNGREIRDIAAIGRFRQLAVHSTCVTACVCVGTSSRYQADQREDTLIGSMCAAMYTGRTTDAANR